MILGPLRLGVFAAAALLGLAGAPCAEAGENIVHFQRNILTDDEWEFVRRNYFKDSVIGVLPHDEFERIVRDGRETDIQAARFDIDEDGTDELLVLMFGTYCGTAGCAAYFLERVSGELRELSGDTIDKNLPSTRYIFRDEDRAFYFSRKDPRHGRLLRKYGFPTRMLEIWTSFIEENLDGHEMAAARDRAEFAEELPPEAMLKVDEEMRRRVGSKWDAALAEGERQIQKRQNR